MKNRRKFATEEEKNLIRILYLDHDTAEIATRIGCIIRRIQHISAAIGIKKSPEYLAVLAEKNGKRLAAAGIRNRFQKDGKPWNAGRSFQAGGRSIETQFQPGKNSHTWRPIGTERVSKEGYLQRKITDTGYTTRDYVSVHRLVWTEAGREIPPGHVLIFRDGNKRNFDLGNLELITQTENMQRNTIHRYGPEIQRLAHLRGALQRVLNRRIPQE